MSNLSATDQTTEQTTYNAINSTTTPTFASFQFQTIGKPPDLLKRMTMPADTDMDVDECYEQDISMSSDGNLDTNVPLSEPLETKQDVNKQRSLRERLAMQEDEADKNVADAHMESAFRAVNICAQNSSQTNQLTPRRPSGGSIIHTPSPSTLSGAHQPGHDGTRKVVAVKQSGSASALSTYNDSQSKPVDSQVSLQPSRLQIQAAPKAPNGQIVTEASDPPAFAAFRDLRVRLATSLVNLHPITTFDARVIAQNVKDRYIEVTASAKQACTLAQKALSAAEESMNAAKECLNHAEALRSMADDVLDAIAKIDNDGQKQLWNDSLENLKNGLHDLERLGSQMEIQQRRGFDDMDTGRRKPAAAAQILPNSSGSGPPSAYTVMHSSSRIASSASILMTLEHEAVAATEAWNQQITEQEAERRRIAAEELRKRRAIELQVERENDQVAAAFTAPQAERSEAEETEKACQEKEHTSREHRSKKSESVREVAVLQKVSEEHDAAKIEEEQRAFRQLQQDEEKRKNSAERKLLHQKLEFEKAQARARDAQANENIRQQQLRDQDLKRKEIAAQKQRAASDEAKRIQYDRARMKQSAQSNTPLNESVMLPANPVSVYDSLLHVELPTPFNALHGIDAKKSVKNQAEVVSSEGSVSGTLLSRIGGSVASSQPALQNPPQLENLSTLKSQPASDNLPNPPHTVTPTQSIFSRTSPVSTSALSDITPSVPEKAGSRVDPVSSKNLAHHNFAQENVPPAIPRGETAVAIHKEQPPPSSGILPVARPNFFDAQADNPTKLYIPNGQDLGNITLVPSSKLLPVSAAAQKNNLRHLTKNSQPEVKVEHDEEKPFIKLEHDSTPPISSVVPPSAQNDVITQSTNIHPPTKGELTPSTGVPILSLPSPVRQHTSTSAKNPPVGRLVEAELDRQRSTGPQPVVKDAVQSNGVQAMQSTLDVLPSNISVNQSSIAPTQGTVVKRVPIGQSTSLRAAPSSSLCQTSQSIPQSSSGVSELREYSGNDSSRMGPDIAEHDGWARTTQDNMYAPATAHRQARERTPPRQARQRDHWSPPAGALLEPRFQARNRLPLRVDHYSPSRSPSPPPLHANYSTQRPMRSRSVSRGMGGSNNSRVVTPEQTTYHTQTLHHQPLPSNRKRAHVGDQNNEPPNRRPRYDAPLREVQPSYPTVHQSDWSHVADYSRSPSPEAPRATSLQMRLGEETDRAPYYRHNQSFPNRQRTEAQHYNRSVATQVPYQTQFSNSHVFQPNLRQTTDSRLPLLDRFSVQAPSYTLPPIHNHVHAPTTRNVNRGRGRGNAHQPLGNRIAKGALIDRLAVEQQPDDNNDE